MPDQLPTDATTTTQHDQVCEGFALGLTDNVPNRLADGPAGSFRPGIASQQPVGAQDRGQEPA